MFALRASGTSENYLTAFNRWAESLVFLSVLWTVPSTCSLFYSLQSRRLPLTAHFTLSSGCISLQEWILLPYTPPLSLRRTELFALFSQPASHRNVPLEVTHLKQLAERNDFDNRLQFRSLVMFVLAFSGFFRSSELCLTRSKHVQFSSSYVSIFTEKSRLEVSVPPNSSPFFYYLAWAWLTDAPMPPSVVMFVRLYSGGKIYNFCILELTLFCRHGTESWVLA